MPARPNIDATPGDAYADAVKRIDTGSVTLIGGPVVLRGGAMLNSGRDGYTHASGWYP